MTTWASFSHANVEVAETDDGAQVGFANPGSMLDIADSPDLRPVADEAAELLRRACDSL